MMKPLWKTVPKEIKNATTTSISMYIPKKIKIRLLKRYWYTHVHNIIHSKNTEGTQVTINR